MKTIMHHKKHILLAILLAAYGIALITIDPHADDGAPNIAGLAAALDAAPVTLNARTKTSGCSPGSLPDPACTPGAVFTDVTTDQICEKGYTQTARNVSASLKKKIFKEYGISIPQPAGAYEVDHLIPLEIGGSNDIANLFPQPKTPFPGFPEKDLVENFLHQEACAGRISIEKAQRAIAANWIDVYESIGSEQLAELKAKYGSWAR